MQFAPRLTRWLQSRNRKRIVLRLFRARNILENRHVPMRTFAIVARSGSSDRVFWWNCAQARSRRTNDKGHTLNEQEPPNKDRTANGAAAGNSTMNTNRQPTLAISLLRKD